ncbi:D-alanyl-D-alanine carboxypeptidase/D-alanyl-D-alanine-endopeptidase [Streptomyces albulus]|nr:D-alanyl-D-alanine carboxypeptidase/D-alanyl-D-alanine-endopeptidase [Streptomyces noursei]
MRPAPPSAPERIAVVHSLPLSDLVERMLTYSDNDIAEALARQTALAAHRPASFDGAAAAVRDALAAQHLPLAGAVFADGSGLDQDDKVSANLLSHLLLAAAASNQPDLRPIVTGLPVAAFTGTLSGRYVGDTAGAGTVRAKTGTLTGVNTLAGTVVDADGRLLAFAFMTTGTTDPRPPRRPWTGWPPRSPTAAAASGRPVAAERAAPRPDGRRTPGNLRRPSRSATPRRTGPVR